MSTDKELERDIRRQLSPRRLKRLRDSHEALGREVMADPAMRRVYNDTKLKLKLAREIRKIRDAAGLSQKDVAGKIGTTQSNIARIEKGGQNLTIRMLKSYADACGRKLNISFA